jgi:RHS repeat-associated protein
MNTFIFFKRPVLCLLLLAAGLIARATEPGWQVMHIKNYPLASSSQSGGMFQPQYVIGTPSGSTTIYAAPTPTAITPELAALATGLDNDPVKIFNYVHNQIDFQPYFGSVKGAQTTYLDGAGNDMDQASLLIALLNQAGYTSTKYVYGSVTMTDASLANWLQTTTALSHWIILYTGIPYYSGPVFGNGTSSQFQHTWVEVTINGTTYDLDPSYKQYPNLSPIDFNAVKTAIGYSSSDLLSAAGGTTDGTSYVQNMSRSNLEAKLGTYANNLRSYIKTNYPNAEIEQIIGGGHILPQPITALAQGAPPAAFSPAIQATFSTLPVQYQDSQYTSAFSLHATYEVKIDSDIDETFYTDSLQSTRLSLVFSDLNAQIWLGDTLTVQQLAGSGATANVTMTVETPNFAPYGAQLTPCNRSGTYDLTYALLPSQSSREIDESTRQIQNYLASGLPDNSRQVLTETLHSLGLQWARRCALNTAMVARLQGVFLKVGQIIGRTAQDGGYYVDMGGNTIFIVDSSATAESPNGVAGANAFNTEGFFSSAFEHGVIEQDPVTNPPTAAISTTKCLSLANDAGQKIFLVNSANYNSIIISQLTNYSPGELSVLNTEINTDGDIVLMHQNGLTGGDATKNQWAGSGYMTFNINSEIFGALIYGPWGSSSSGGISLDEVTVSGIDDLSNLYATYGTDSIPVDGVSKVPTATPKSAEPVDLLTGAYTMTHADLTLGQQGSPMGLNFTRYYDSSRNFMASPLGNGWRHSCQGSVTVCSELDNAFGLTQPTDATQTLIGLMVAGDFVSTSSNPQQLMVGVLAADWTVNRITNNAANVQLGNQTMTYISQPDGTWNPPPGSTTALTGASGSFALQPRFGGSIAFNAQNLISQWTDVDGNAQNYNYDGSGNLSTVQDAFGRTLTFNYSSGLLQSVVDSTSRSVRFAYTTGTSTGVNSSSNLTGITDPAGYNTTLVYDSSNRLTDWKDNAGAPITHNDYDVLDRVYQQFSQNLSADTWLFHYSPGMTQEIDPQGDEDANLFDYKNRNIGMIDALGHASSASYDGQNHVILATDATGRQTASFYDGNQDLLKTTDNSSPADNIGTTQYFYDSSFPFHLTKVTDATGLSTQYGYDSHNHLTSTTDPAGRVTQYFYKSNGLPDHVIDPAGNSTTYTTYDAYGNPTKVTHADGTTTSATYNVRGDVLTSINALNHTTTYTYDPRRLVSTCQDAFGKTATWTYDSNGNPATVTDRNGHTTTYVYDNLGHKQSVQSPTDLPAAPTKFAYDTRDWLTSVTNELGNPTSFGYDATGRKTSTTNPLSIVTSQTVYDAAGRVTGQIDALGNETKFGYDGVGRLQSSQDPLYSPQDPLHHSIDYTYDLAGRKLTLTNKNANTFEFGYSTTDGLPTTFTYASFLTTGRQSQISARNADGLPAMLISPSGHQTVLTYDVMSRVKTSADGVGTITSTYDNNGNVTDVTETIGSTNTDIHRVFDNLNRVTSCTDTQGNTLGYTYDNEGNLATITYPGNKVVNYTYDGSNRLTTVTDWAGRVTNYTYDYAGRLQTVLRPNSTQQSVTFDAASRLTASSEQLVNSNGVVVNTLWSALYGYDNDNHLTAFVPTPLEPTPAPAAATTTYNADNEVATFNGQNVSYDLDGNMQSAPVTVAGSTSLGALTWDARNRLTSAGGVTYTYDAENRRISSTVNGQTTFYVWARGRSLDKLLAKQNPDGSTTRYVYGASGLLYEETTSAGGTAQTPIYYHFDWRGDTVALSDASGNVIEQLSYSPYGDCTVTPVTGTVNTPFGFNGEWGVLTEPTGLLAMQARFYSPVIQRFLNEDPSGFSGGNNLYAFAAGDPVDLMDPFGLGPQSSNGFLNELNYQLGPDNPYSPLGILNNVGNAVLQAAGEVQSSVSYALDRMGVDPGDQQALAFATMQPEFMFPAAFPAAETETAQITLNRQAGISFQDQVTTALGATPGGPMTGTTLTGASYTTIPDGILQNGSLLEVKNSQYVSFSPQLQAQVSIGKNSGVGNILVVNPATTVSQPVISAFGHTPANPTIFTFNPATSTLAHY